ncbi:unnamed protein product [Meganyctiphanes norvegica]|uniref:C-type lectin domain-containing protein n=1 Tax=Meganyctiphanes norvegica TaxID=48144 RepID=A0AAV2RNH1_MEGNR
MIDIDESVSWDESNAKCVTEGLVMATQPDDAIALRQYIVDNYGDKAVHLGAKGDGSVFRWVDTGDVISNTDDLWVPGNPGSSVTPSDCLVLMSIEWFMNDAPTHPFYSVTCSAEDNTLCEYLVE